MSAGTEAWLATLPRVRIQVAPPVNIPIPIKIGSKMGGPTAKWNPIGFDPQPYIFCISSLLQAPFLTALPGVVVFDGRKEKVQAACSTRACAAITDADVYVCRRKWQELFNGAALDPHHILVLRWAHGRGSEFCFFVSRPSIARRWLSSICALWRIAEIQIQARGMPGERSELACWLVLAWWRLVGAHDGSTLQF